MTHPFPKTEVSRKYTRVLTIVSVVALSAGLFSGNATTVLLGSSGLAAGIVRFVVGSDWFDRWVQKRLGIERGVS